MSDRVTVIVLLVAVQIVAAGAAVLALRYGGVLPAVGSGLVVAGVGALWLLVDDGEAS